MKANKNIHPIQQIRVYIHNDSLCITSTKDLPKEVFDRIVSHNIMECYDKMFPNGVYIRHFCLSTDNNTYASCLMLTVDDKNNTLDKIVELSNLLTSLHYEILRQEKTSYIILQHFGSIRNAIQYERVITHDALPRKRRVKSPFKDAESKSSNETTDQ